MNTNKVQNYLIGKSYKISLENIEAVKDETESKSKVF